jgi:hypothetical protein
MRRLSAHLAFDDYIKLTRRFHFLVALGLPGSDTEAFAECIQFQCNCSLFWRRNACQHSLLCGTYLKKSSGGFIPKVATLPPRLVATLPLRLVATLPLRLVAALQNSSCSVCLSSRACSVKTAPKTFPRQPLHWVKAKLQTLLQI